MQMLHLGYIKFIQINAKDKKLPWICIKHKMGVFVSPVRQLNKKRTMATDNSIL